MAAAAFLDDDCLLSNATARSLFHEVAEHAPVVDLHNHLPAADIASDRSFETLADLWLEDDHYKWRAMRLTGHDERVITGDAEPWERFAAWAETVPLLVGNPLYVWTHLELRRVFGIDIRLGPSTAREIWEEANRQLPGWTAGALLRRFRVAAVATTDDPADALVAHERLRGGAGPAVIPTFRPDAAHRLVAEPEAWNEWAGRLGERAGVAIDDLESLLLALASSFDRFAALGCRASDHGLTALPDVPRDPALADAAVRRVLEGGPPHPAERQALLLEVLTLAARLAADREGVLQLHLGALRDLSPRVLALAGRDAGADAMGDESQAAGLARLLGTLEADRILPRTVLYNVNPADNALFAAVAGAFSRPGVASLVQWGPPWWFNDHESGIRRQLDDLGQIGLLSGFVGMVTDSRSLLSLTRHELFRRILCDALGRDAEAGRIPADRDLLDPLVAAVCVGNAARFFGLDPLPVQS
jgi:glucuronate isomerase